MTRQTANRPATLLPRRHPIHRYMRTIRSAGLVQMARAAAILTIMLLLVLGTTPAGTVAVQTSPPSTGAEASVFVIPIHGEIEPGIGSFLERSLDEAEDAGASAVILDISSPGGRLDTVLEMRDVILGTPLRTIAFVDREAFSAGALITIASSEIWMAPGAVFGAATPVNGGTGETADPKTVSAVRSTFAATAEERGRNPLIAEAMVDTSVVVVGLDSATTLLSLTPAQASEYGYLDGVAADQTALLASLGFGGATVTETGLSPIEHIVRVVTDPFFASLLILIGLFLIIADGFFQGFGVISVIGVLCLGLFFFGHLLGGLAGWEDVLLVALGLGLIALEVFVLPGFGIAGFSGLIATGAGLFLAMIGRNIGDVPITDEVVTAGWAVVLAVAGALTGLVVVSFLVPRLTGVEPGRGFGLGRLTLKATVDGDDQFHHEVERRSSWLVRLSHGDDVLERDQPLSLPEPRERESRSNR